MALLLLATVNGQLVSYDTHSLVQEVLFQTRDDEPLMGICQHEDMLYVASLSRVFKLRMVDHALVKKTRIHLPSPGFHQMNFYDGKLYATASRRNQIWIFDEDLKRRARITISPPDPDKRVRFKSNYNHINNIVRHQGAFYINLNWLTNEQYAHSGVLKTDEDFNELEKFQFAWESHDFQFVHGRMMAICSTSGKDKEIRHPNTSGLMVDGELVWEHNPDESFCKSFCTDKQYIYFCGGIKAERKKRKNTSGVIYVIDKNTFQLVNKITSKQLKGIRGAMLIKSE